LDARDWNERYRATERLWTREPNLFVTDRLWYNDPGRALDLAAGEGRNAIWLASRGWSVTAVDFSVEAVLRGRSEKSEVDFVVADVLEWEPEGVFELVLIAYLHVVSTDFEKAVRRSREWLVPGGEVFMIGHDESNIDHGYGGPQYPEILWDVDEIVGWLDGMDLVEAQVVRRPVETDTGLKFARDALVRARARPVRTEPH
jgi:SAM-dependent methyltransferase